MSSEAYVPEGAAAFNQASLTTAPDSAPLDAPKTTYLCGDCNLKVELSRGDPIRCRDCGHRVLYKMRTTRMVQFEAR